MAQHRQGASTGTSRRLRNPGFLPLTAAFTRHAARDLLSHRPEQGAVDDHLYAAVDWLKRAQDVTGDGGVSQGYYFFRHGRWGWLGSYRETSGYIVETFLDLAREFGEDEYRQRALQIARWLCTVQNPDGSYSNPNYRGGGIVFDTGQVLFGLTRAYRKSGEPQFLDAAVKAGRWLCDKMDDDGAWRRNTHNRCVHTYNTRSAWALLELHALAPEKRLTEAARANLDWASRQEREGWFRLNAFKPEEVPFTHNIAYAIRGFLEAGEQLKESRYTDIARRAAEKLIPHVGPDGFVPARIDRRGARARSACLTGNCQLSIIWARLFESSGEEKFLDAATRSLGYVISHQDINTPNPDIRGGIKGSQPIWGRYSPLSYPNWAAKFFIDAVLQLGRRGP